jgi:hypothetical protein
MDMCVYMCISDVCISKHMFLHSQYIRTYMHVYIHIYMFSYVYVCVSDACISDICSYILVFVHQVNYKLLLLELAGREISKAQDDKTRIQVLYMYVCITYIFVHVCVRMCMCMFIHTYTHTGNSARALKH